MKYYLSSLIALTLSSVTLATDQRPASADYTYSHSHEHHHHLPLPAGSNEMLRTPTGMADGLEVIISDVIIPPNATIPRHYHPGEEYIYILEGSVIHVEEGKEDQLLKAGMTYVIPPKAEHAPRATEEGARAVVFRIHVEGKPERILVEE